MPIERELTWKSQAGQLTKRIKVHLKAKECMPLPIHLPIFGHMPMLTKVKKSDILVKGILVECCDINPQLYVSLIEYLRRNRWAIVVRLQCDKTLVLFPHATENVLTGIIVRATPIPKESRNDGCSTFLQKANN